MASKNIVAKGTTYNGVESVTFPVSGGGDATFYEISDTTAAASDVASGKYFFTSSGVKTEGTASGGGGGGYGYTLLGSTELTINTDSTSYTNQGDITVAAAWTAAKIIYVRVRDKAGKRNGYFYGSDRFFINDNAGKGSTSALTSGGCYYYRYNNDTIAMTIGTAGYGVFGHDINTSGRVRIYSRYNSTNTLTIDGTYICEVYALDWPDGISPFA